MLDLPQAPRTKLSEARNSQVTNRIALPREAACRHRSAQVIARPQLDAISVPCRGDDRTQVQMTSAEQPEIPAEMATQQDENDPKVTLQQAMLKGGEDFLGTFRTDDPV